MEEVWKDINGFDGYQVSNHGRVRSFWEIGRWKRKKSEPVIKNQHSHYRGYKYVSFSHSSEKKYVHRLVAEAFIRNPEGKEFVNHIDENKTNNRVDNLEWVTAKQNSAHSFLGERNTASKLNSKYVIEIRKLLNSSELTCREIGEKYGVSKHAILSIKHGRTWSHIPKN